MQFSVPQFIEVEDRIIGPLTLKQFLYILGGAGVMFLLYTFFTLPFFIVTSIPVAGVAALFAFYKPNGRNFATFVGAITRFLTRPRTYIWQRTPDNRNIDTGEVVQKQASAVDETVGKDVTESRLKRLAFVLDTAGGLEEIQAVAENLRHTGPSAGAQPPVAESADAAVPAPPAQTPPAAEPSADQQQY